MKNNYLVISIAVLLITTLTWFALQNSTHTTPANTPTPTASNTVTLSFGKYNYNPETITAKAGEPLSITADLRRITGCYRSFRVPALQIAGHFSEANPTITFTPTTPGTYLFTCSMGMGRGTLIIT